VSYELSISSKLTGRMKEMVGLSSTPSAIAKKHADINIFTVASGLLYEVSYQLRAAFWDKLILSDLLQS
jgi:hypothetical protein